MESSDLGGGTDFPAPWTQGQLQFARSPDAVRVLRGSPGTGKTTALWQSVQARDGEQVLYLTWSSRLAEIAGEYFFSFKPRGTEVTTRTFAELVRDLTEEGPGGPTESQGQAAFLDGIRRLHPSTLGPWSSLPESLYAEVRAHVVGACVLGSDDLSAVTEPRLTNEVYRKQREGILGGSAVDAVLAAVKTLESISPIWDFFPELARAWRAARRLRDSTGLPASYALFDRLVVDEVQDLTPVEATVVLLLAHKVAEMRGGCAPFLLLAGDEAQTVRPTDFEWGWLKRLVTSHLCDPKEMALTANVRCPRRIAAVINATKALYRHLPKDERPRGLEEAEVEEATSDVVIACLTPSGPALRELLLALRDQPSLRLVRFGEEMPAYVPEEIRDTVLTAAEVKGLDFQAICLLDAGKVLESVADTTDHSRRGSEVERLWKKPPWITCTSPSAGRRRP